MASIDPKIWGSSAWKLLHDISFYVEGRAAEGDYGAMKDARRFFMVLRGVLPCMKCQLSYDRHLLNLPFPQHGAALPRWVFELHNRVNDRLDKRSGKHTWAEWSASYRQGISRRRLKDIWPFVQSVAEIYPHGSRYEVGIYRHNVREFFGLLWSFLRNMEGYSRDMLLIEGQVDMKSLEDNIGSRRRLLGWVTDMGRKAHILSKKHSNCDNRCEA